MQKSYQAVGKSLADEHSYAQAEKYFVRGDDWKAAVNMYRAANQWEDAYRVGKFFHRPLFSRIVKYTPIQKLSTKNNDYGGRFQEYDLSYKILNAFRDLTLNFSTSKTRYILGDDHNLFF